MKFSILFAALLCTSQLMAGVLTEIGNKFVSSAVKGDFVGVEETLWSGAAVGQKAAMLEGIKGAAGAIESGQVEISHVGKELVIGNLGATLLRIEAKSGTVDYDPIIYVKDGEGWHIVPWGDQEGLRVFAASRTDDEQIHLKLLNTWGSLVEEQLVKEEKAQGGESKEERSR
ncbi:MAG: hypothetical protein ACSHYF_15880 [Verrucomicrobiaceae bacterium]